MLETEVIDLTDCYQRCGDYDGGECYDCARLCEVVGSESSEGYDAAESVVVQGADPACSEPENGSFELCC